MKAYELSVRGKVQRVGYRRYLLGLAQGLGLSGYIENRPDGTVHIFAQGPEERLNEFIDKARDPPYPARVSSIDIVEAEPNTEYKYFTVRFGSIEEELQEGFGSMQSIFMEYWREFRDYRQEFKDYRSEFRGFADRTDKNFQTLMEKYGEISAKLTEIMNMLLEESRKTSEMLNTLRKESKETREILIKNLELLRQAVEKLGQKQ